MQVLYLVSVITYQVTIDLSSVTYVCMIDASLMICVVTQKTDVITNLSVGCF